MPTELALSAYRPFPGKADELQAFFADELATLRRRGHVTDRRAPVVRTEAGELLVVLEWSSEDAAGDAHKDPENLALWRRNTETTRGNPPRGVRRSGIP